MYGTVARMRVMEGKEAELEKLFEMEASRDTPGFVFAHIYRMDNDPHELMLVVGFDSKASYRTNAESPEQDAEYRGYRALLETDPEWHDGEIVVSEVRAATAAD